MSAYNKTSNMQAISEHQQDSNPLPYHYEADELTAALC